MGIEPMSALTLPSSTPYSVPDYTLYTLGNTSHCTKCRLKYVMFTKQQKSPHEVPSLLYVSVRLTDTSNRQALNRSYAKARTGAAVLLTPFIVFDSFFTSAESKLGMHSTVSLTRRSRYAPKHFKDTLIKFNISISLNNPTLHVKKCVKKAILFTARRKKILNIFNNFF